MDSEASGGSNAGQDVLNVVMVSSSERRRHGCFLLAVSVVETVFCGHPNVTLAFPCLPFIYSSHHRSLSCLKKCRHGSTGRAGRCPW